ncbi:alkyl hydroperoxide reductase [Sorangium cellulosum]|uniref:Alkyl hydroperoxide reductase n=1 Tax=Sorangium cellulosum TaxID=56 RepID=A0A4P2PZE1_SORCE|nr:peroxiredoxin-like family protein [Sorangium cellulosum]AUX22284.1 alkyl hydroperoxide reductase [Sorangium cellulosum]
MKSSRLSPGDRVSPCTLRTLRGAAIALPDPSALVHLQFRRFAGCPICELHLRAFAKRYVELRALGVREVVLFHSSEDALRPYQGEMPFDVVADPRRVHYDAYGVGTSLRMMADPRTWRAMLSAIRAAEQPIPTRPDGGPLGLPADFFLDPSGTVLDAKYGEHPDDQWSFDEVLERARRFTSERARGATP